MTTGVDQIIRVIDGEPLPEPTGKPAAALQSSAVCSVIFILVLGIGGVLRTVLGRFPGALATGGAVAVIAWLWSARYPSRWSRA